MSLFTTPGPSHLEILRLERADARYDAAFCLVRPDWPALRESRGQFLHSEERDYFATLKFERRQKSYLTGRYAAKQVLIRLRSDLSPTAIAVRPGVFHQPVVHGAGENLQVSISHAGASGAAIAFPEDHPMSVDIEELNDEKDSAIQSQVTDAEYNLVAPLACEDAQSPPSLPPVAVRKDIRALTLLWTAKEAMAKVIRCGMMTPFSIFEIATAKREGRAVVCTFGNFAQYKAVCLFQDRLVVAIVSPKNTTFSTALPARLNA